jgi:translation elongation factor EF-Ts
MPETTGKAIGNIAILCLPKSVRKGQSILLDVTKQEMVHKPKKAVDSIVKAKVDKHLERITLLNTISL